jgi:hypothetical protein
MLPCTYNIVLIGTYINLVYLDAGDEDSLNWEQRLHIALDAAQGPHFNYVCTLIKIICVCVF